MTSLECLTYWITFCVQLNFERIFYNTGLSQEPLGPIAFSKSTFSPESKHSDEIQLCFEKQLEILLDKSYAHHILGKKAMTFSHCLCHLITILSALPGDHIR